MLKRYLIVAAVIPVLIYASYRLIFDTRTQADESAVVEEIQVPVPKRATPKPEKVIVAEAEVPPVSSDPALANTVPQIDQAATIADTRGFCASKNSEVYHQCNCSGAKRIKPENLIRFKTEAEAKASSRRRCRCK